MHFKNQHWSRWLTQIWTSCTMGSAIYEFKVMNNKLLLSLIWGWAGNTPRKILLVSGCSLCCCSLDTLPLSNHPSGPLTASTHPADSDILALVPLRLPLHSAGPRSCHLPALAVCLPLLARAYLWHLSSNRMHACVRERWSVGWPGDSHRRLSGGKMRPILQAQRGPIYPEAVRTVGCQLVDGFPSVSHKHTHM